MNKRSTCSQENSKMDKLPEQAIYRHLVTFHKTEFDFKHKSCDNEVETNKVKGIGKI